VSFWAYSTVAGTFPVAIRNGAANRAYVTTFAIPATTWTKISVTIPPDTTGTWTYDNTAGAILAFCFGAGSTYQASAANAWSAGNFFTVPGCANLMATLNAQFLIAQVQVELGSTATPYEHRGVGLETTLCERYYRRVISSIVGGIALVGYSGAGGFLYYVPMMFPAMRSPPNGPRNGLIGTWTYTNGSGAGLSINSPSAMLIYFTIAAAGVGSASCPANGGFALDAEL
jgi:hypothetical protein